MIGGAIDASVGLRQGIQAPCATFDVGLHHRASEEVSPINALTGRGSLSRTV